jgi:hypothetical protein
VIRIIMEIGLIGWRNRLIVKVIKRGHLLVKIQRP